MSLGREHPAYETTLLGWTDKDFLRVQYHILS